LPECSCAAPLFLYRGFFVGFTASHPLFEGGQVLFSDIDSASLFNIFLPRSGQQSRPRDAVIWIASLSENVSWIQLDDLLARCERSVLARFLVLLHGRPWVRAQERVVSHLGVLADTPEETAVTIFTGTPLGTPGGMLRSVRDCTPI
jgi:hypothetical protein